MFQGEAVEKIKTHILCSINFFRKLLLLLCFLNRAVYVIMWKNKVERDRLHMHIAFSIPKARNIYLE